MYQRDREQYPDNAWVHTSDYFSITPEQEGTYNLVVLLCRDAGWDDAVTSPSAAIDNLEIGFSSCTRPVNVVAGELTSESAEITWTAQPGAVSYDVQFVTLDDGQAEPSPDVNVAVPLLVSQGIISYCPGFVTSIITVLGPAFPMAYVVAPSCLLRNRR